MTIFALSITHDHQALAPEDIVFVGVIYAGVLQANFRVPSNANVGNVELLLSAQLSQGRTPQSPRVGRLWVK